MLFSDKTVITYIILDSNRFGDFFSVSIGVLFMRHCIVAIFLSKRQLFRISCCFSNEFYLTWKIWGVSYKWHEFGNIAKKLLWNFKNISTKKLLRNWILINRHYCVLSSFTWGIQVLILKKSPLKLQMSSKFE